MPPSAFLRNTACVSSQGIFLCDLRSLPVEGALEMETPGVERRAEGKHLFQGSEKAGLS